MKKKIFIVVIAIFSVLIVCFLSLIIFYNKSLEAVGSNDEVVTVIVEQGSSSKEIVDTIYNSGLLKNKYAGYIYLKLHSDYILQAGVYEINKGMDFREILEYLSNGNVIDNSVSITFVEGKRLTNYVSLIASNFDYTEEEILEFISNEDYLKGLIDKYWFLTDEILNDKLYYALEGYLYPNTYQFAIDASIDEIIEKMLNAMEVVLDKYKEEIDSSNYSVHEILSMASIIELEAVTKEDRDTVSQVIFSRLSLGMTLGMDVTTYYAVQKDMSEELWYSDLNTDNPYNTRVVSGLPVGPICNSSVDAIDAVFNPSDTNYIYFYADVTTGDVYFAETESEFYDLISKYGV